MDIMDNPPRAKRPFGIIALCIFFAFGAAVSMTSAISILTPGGWLEPMWIVNPRARESFTTMGMFAPILLFAVSAACATASIGLWRRKMWGYRVAVGMFLANLIGDSISALLGIEPRAVIGIPIVAVILYLLTRKRAREYFELKHHEVG